MLTDRLYTHDSDTFWNCTKEKLHEKKMYNFK